MSIYKANAMIVLVVGLLVSALLIVTYDVFVSVYVTIESKIIRTIIGLLLIAPMYPCLVIFMDVFKNNRALNWPINAK